MGNDMFNEAERNFANAEAGLMAFWNIIKKPIMFVINKISELFEKIFQEEDETTKFQLKKLPL